jgi:uncharacterized protein (TIGR02466 family)
MDIVYQLFPISVFQSNIPVDENLKDFLKNQEYERMPSNNGQYTKNKYILDLPENENLKNQIFQKLQVYLRDYMFLDKKSNFVFQNSWVNKHIEDDYAQKHIHANSLISGVYYLETYPDSGHIAFFKPEGYTNMFHISMNIPYERYETYNCEEYRIIPENGMILFFPSHLLHSVGKNNSKKYRYSMAFNFYVEGEFCSKDVNIDYLKLKVFNKND